MHRLVIALVTLLGLTGAFVVGTVLLFSGASTDRAANFAPANTAAYVNVYLQPSAGQQMNLAELIGRLPGFADDASLDDKIDQVAQNLLGGAGIDYQADLKPWIGSQVAVAAWPDEAADAGSRAVLIAEVRDRAAAETALPSLLGTAPNQFTAETYNGAKIRAADAGAYAFVDEMMVAGPDAESLEAAIDAGRGSSLADRPEFRTTLEDLPADHLASAFVDLTGFAQAAGAELEDVGGLSTAGAVLVAETEGLHLSGTAPFDIAEAEPSARARFALGTEPSSLVDWMPADTVAEAVVFGLRQTLEDAETILPATPEGEEVVGLLSSIRALAAFGLGINIDDEVLPLLDREVGVSVTGLEGDRPSGQLLLRPSDGDAAAGMLDSLAQKLEGAGATREVAAVDGLEGVDITLLSLPDTVDLAWAVVDGIVIIGFTPEDVAAAISAHESGDALGAEDGYETAFAVAGERAGTEAYVDVPALVELLGDDVSLPDDARDILLQIGSFALTASSNDDHIEFHAVLMVDDRPTD
jgi:hypothetical protein